MNDERMDDERMDDVRPAAPGTCDRRERRGRRTGLQ